MGVEPRPQNSVVAETERETHTHTQGTRAPITDDQSTGHTDLATFVDQRDIAARKEKILARSSIGEITQLNGAPSIGAAMVRMGLKAKGMCVSLDQVSDHCCHGQL